MRFWKCECLEFSAFSDKMWIFAPLYSMTFSSQKLTPEPWLIFDPKGWQMQPLISSLCRRQIWYPWLCHQWCDLDRRSDEFLDRTVAGHQSLLLNDHPMKSLNPEEVLDYTSSSNLLILGKWRRPPSCRIKRSTHCHWCW